MMNTKPSSAIQGDSVTSLMILTWSAASATIMVICFDTIAIMPPDQHLYYTLLSLIYIPIAGFVYAAIISTTLLAVGMSFFGILYVGIIIYEALRHSPDSP